MPLAASATTTVWVCLQPHLPHDVIAGGICRQLVGGIKVSLFTDDGVTLLEETSIKFSATIGRETTAPSIPSSVLPSHVPFRFSLPPHLPTLPSHIFSLPTPSLPSAHHALFLLTRPIFCSLSLNLSLMSFSPSLPSLLPCLFPSPPNLCPPSLLASLLFSFP